MVLAQDTRCRDPYLDNSIADDQRAEMLLDSAGACVREGRSLQSIALFRELIGLATQDPTAYLNRGSSYLQIGQFELGLADLDHVSLMRQRLGTIAALRSSLSTNTIAGLLI